MLRGRSDIKKACLTCLIRPCYSLFLFPSFLPFVLLWSSLLRPLNAICSTVLFSVTSPFASCFLSCERHWRWCVQPRNALPLFGESVNRGWPAPAPRQPQSWTWPCCMFAGSPQVSVYRGLGTTHIVLLCPTHSPICASLMARYLLSCSFLPSLAGKTSFLSRPPFISSLLETLFHSHKSTRELYKPDFCLQTSWRRKRRHEKVRYLFQSQADQAEQAWAQILRGADLLPYILVC